jgi:hypothetical protein
MAPFFPVRMRDLRIAPRWALATALACSTSIGCASHDSNEGRTGAAAGTTNASAGSGAAGRAATSGGAPSTQGGAGGTDHSSSGGASAGTDGTGNAGHGGRGDGGGGGSPAGTGGTSAGRGAEAGKAGAAFGGAGDGAAGRAGSGGSAVTGGEPTIENDRFWKDTAGAPIYSQGGGVLQVAGTYYWYGVKYGGAPTYAANPTSENSDTSFHGVTIYSSEDLVNWKLETTNMLDNVGDWFGRLGVAYNAKTKKYVLVAQGGGGLYFATSDTPNGGFVLDNVQTNLPGIVNGATGDQTIFQDDDGQAYLVSSSSMGRANRYVSPLRAADFLAAENAVLVYKGGGREGNCMFKYEGNYYFCSSDLHGWNSSPSYCVSAPDIRGPYGAEFVLDGTERDYSHVTQTGFFVAVKGTSQTTIIFAGDRWSDFAGNGLGYNQWLPLSFTGTTAHFNSLSAWSLNATTGSWHVAPGNNWILNPTFEADRVTVTVPVGWTSTAGTNSKDAVTGNWSWQLAPSGSLSQMVASLPNGTYTLTLAAKSTGTGAEVSVKNAGGAALTLVIPASTSFKPLTLTNIAVTSGGLELDVTSGTASVTLDDFTLTGG